MAKIIKSYSDTGRTSILATIKETANSDIQNNQPLVSGETLGEIEKVIPEWTAKTLELNRYLSGREKEIREANESYQALETVLRDGWEVTKRRMNRLDQPAEVLTYYQLPLSGIVPKSIKRKELISLAQKVAEGDAKAVAAGYPEMLNPDVNELKAAIEKAEKESIDVAPSDRAYDMAEEAVEVLRPKVDTLISDALDELRFYLRKKDPASQRRIIKSYGYEIVYTNTNQTDNEPLEN